MNQQPLKIKRALISVSDKTDLTRLANTLIKNDIEIISTGGTAKFLRQQEIKVTEIFDVTDFPELMSGRIKTLHPLLLGGILGRRDIDAKEAAQYNIHWIDLVVCNLYPFEQITRDPSSTLDEKTENIDIGGPTMLRAAAKNFQWVTTIASPKDYPSFIAELDKGGIELSYRKYLAQKVFKHTADYDAIIAKQLFLKHENDSKENKNDDISLQFQSLRELRYGENPHQRAWLLQDKNKITHAPLGLNQLQGKALSYNNLLDSQAAIESLEGLNAPAAVVIKHTIPCGLAQGSTIGTALTQAFNADKKSAFGGIVALNQPCNKEINKESKLFIKKL